MSTIDQHQLNYIVNHIFLPPKLPQEDDQVPENDRALCAIVYRSIFEYRASLPIDEQVKWDPIVKMQECICILHDSHVLPKDHLKTFLSRMHPGDVLSLLIRTQNAGVILRKFENQTIFEAFEVSPTNAVVMGAEGKLLCSYPGPAVAVPAHIFQDAAFREEFSSFLVQMNVDILDSAATTIKAKSTVVEIRDSAHPKYITDLLTQILLGMGAAADVRRIQKRIADDVMWKSALKPWRRSPLWLVIRVALQTSLYNISGNHTDYKAFMVFMMGKILQIGSEYLLPSDLLFCMRGKLSRRLYKLGAAAPDSVARAVQKSGEDTEKLLQRRWLEIQNAQECSAHWAPETLDPLQDTRLSLSNSASYISGALERTGRQRSSSAFKPDSFRRFYGFDTFDAANSSLLSDAFAANSYTALYDFELAVQEHLDAWVAQNLHSSSASATIAASVTQYSKIALKLYKSDPQSKSLMFLTLFELWVALDKIAVTQCPLLKDYSPEVPPKLLESLLLSRSQPLARAAIIEEYLRGRYTGVISGWSIFTDEMSSSTFPVRYFSSSSTHQSLKLRIERDARAERDAKLAELGSKNDEYHSLIAKCRPLSHEYWTDRRGHVSHAEYYCPKCSLEREASNLLIAPHEWPLPEDESQAQTVVFELNIPAVFQIWRDTTHEILHDICLSGGLKDVKPPIQLRTYASLEKYNQASSRITLASTTKSFLNSHYKTTSIPSTESDVCLNNGLQFRLYDSVNDAWAAVPFENCSIVKSCTFSLSEGPYTGLQYAVDSTSHTTNKVVAFQSDCSKDLTLHEYFSFAALRSGPRLQWLNIARELRARSLSFHREEVYVLMTQTAWQTGPLVDGDREWHAELKEANFAHVLLHELEDLLLSVEANWLEGVSVGIAIVLTRRLLASTYDSAVESHACAFLRKARQVAFKWVLQLAEKLQESKDDTTVQVFQRRVCEMAAICRGTFDPDHAASLLVFPDDVRILVHCAILVHDNSPVATSLPLGFKRILEQDRRLSHMLEAVLHEQITRSCSGLDQAIVSVWKAYRPGSGWCSPEAPNDHWLMTTTAIQTIGQEPQCVQFNLLNGKLLIDGKPLGRLPTNIVSHLTYCRVLGRKVLDIIPADMPGMDYATRNSIYGYQLFFGMSVDDSNLVIRTRRGTEILELLPHQNLNGDLPKPFVKDHTHWLNISTGEIELRPLDNPWKSAPSNWRIQFSTDGQSKMTQMHRQPTTLLVDIRSSTFGMLSDSLVQLEHAENMIITCSPDDLSLSIDLPRFRLSFFLNDRKHLESRNWPGMVIDSCQSSGTMFGLSSQLVLRTERRELPQPRRVIIPQGRPQARRAGDHVRINIDMTSQSRVKYHEYTIDTNLCRLTCKTLESKLFKIYLHAVSSHCLPDPLTGRSGTQEALHELRSAGCKSFQQLKDPELAILLLIKSLTPEREFYPAGLQVMQTVHWSGLPSLAQHHGFSTIAQTILDYSEQLQSFVGSSPLGSLTTIPNTLLNRSARRNAIFYPEELSDPLKSVSADVVHTSRDLSCGNPGNQVTNISRMVHQWPTRLSTCTQLMEVLQRWGSVSGFDKELSLSYSRHWLGRDLAMAWIPLYRLCLRSVRERDRFGLEFSLTALAYTKAEYQTLLPTILAFATVPQFRELSPPSSPPDYYLNDGFVPQNEKLMQIVHDSAITFEQSSDADLPAFDWEDETTLGRRRYSSFVARRDSQATELVDQLLSQWPCEEPSSSPTTQDRHPWLFNISSLMGNVKPLFKSWYWNDQFRGHLEAVQNVLDAIYLPDTLPILPRFKFTPCISRQSSALSVITFDSLLKRDPPKLALNIPPLPTILREYNNPSHPDFTHPNLESLLLKFKSNSDPLHQEYRRELDLSYRSLDSDFPSITSLKHIPSLKELIEHRDHSIGYLQAMFSFIRKALLRPSNIAESVMLTAGQWPCVTMIALLGKLAPTAGVVLTEAWQRVLIELAQRLLILQRSQRLLYFALTQNEEDLVKELANEDGLVHCDYAIKHPDWLLIQVESNFHVRPIQLQCAYEMMTPSSKKNTVLQLNMGEGKSSVIVPMISAALADGKTLVRVIVLKSLSNQMFRLLVDRLTGLLNRRIFYLPFSRSVMLDAHQVRHIQALNEECMREGGVLVAQPEHILSFKLMAIDKTLCSKSSADHNVAAALVRSQRWLEGHSRDVLDESDEILHVRYQLVYTVGQQRPLEGHPDRWTTAQQVLSLVKRHAICIQNRFPLGIEVQEGVRGQFPFVRILHANAGSDLVSLVSQDILDGRLPNYSFALLGERVCQAAFGFITRMDVPDEDLHLLRAKCEGTSLWSGFLLLRGLLAHGILEYVLKVRQYRVDYGLDQSRSLLAVPYRAKDVPALRAEFGHPDVVILLTCLSYYYQGLSKDQLDHCFQLLYKLDNPTEEYDAWVDVSIPQALRQLSGVNTSDPKQCEEYLFPLFRYRQAVVNFYLSQVVFPKQAKEFPEKLATSGWDIAEVKEKLTTGFSGTNDNRYLLPSSIIQDDPIGQLSTNAKVLTYLLQSENNHYLCTNPSGQACSARNFLKLLVDQTPEIRVLLDVGAQMLDLQNQKLAEHWLSLVSPDVQAVVFFGDNDEPAVLTRDGILESFVSSPFNQQLEKCLVYLDDAHTRGTDLKLPRNYRAAVTLGPKVTKDRLLQGCMRMRKLGHGQSVMFFAPLEVDRKIRESARKSSDHTLETLDILRWAMHMTCMDIKHHIPHWAQQGLDYKNRSEAWGRFYDNPLSINILQSSWLQVEARSLETMYGVSNSAGHGSEQIHTAFDIPAIRDRCQTLGVHSLSDPRMEEEQEREVSHEIERERQVQRPPKTQPAKHTIDPDVRTFVETGVVSQQSHAFSSPFSSMAGLTDHHLWSPNLLATRDFSTTICSPVSNATDYLRPVNWIVTSAFPHGTLFVLLSPYEVNELLQVIRRSKNVHLHQYSARVTRTMKSFEHLMFYCIPSFPSPGVSPPIDLRNQLNLWAGQLYLEDLETYLRLCNFLGLYTTKPPENFTVQADGFIQPHDRSSMALPHSPFTKSPLPFLRELTGLRRKGMGYMSSHMGKILHAKLLMEGDFQ